MNRTAASYKTALFLVGTEMKDPLLGSKGTPGFKGVSTSYSKTAPFGRVATSHTELFKFKLNKIKSNPKLSISASQIWHLWLVATVLDHRDPTTAVIPESDFGPCFSRKFLT